MAVNPSDSDASLTSTGLRVYVVASMSAADFFNTCPMAMVYGNTALWKLLVGHVAYLQVKSIFFKIRPAYLFKAYVGRKFAQENFQKPWGNLPETFEDSIPEASGFRGVAIGPFGGLDAWATQCFFCCHGKNPVFSNTWRMYTTS